jgi:alanine dehydrogenase
MNEVKMIRENQIIYTYLHLAAAKELTLGFNGVKINLYSV